MNKNKYNNKINESPKFNYNISNYNNIKLCNYNDHLSDNMVIASPNFGSIKFNNNLFANKNNLDE